MTDSIVTIMRPRYVVVWSEDLSTESKKVCDNICAEFKKNIGAYEDWPEIPSGADIYDFSYDFTLKKGKPIFTGCWQTFSPRLERSVHHNGKSHQLQLCIETSTKSSSYGGQRWCDAVKKWQQDLPKENKGFGIIPYTEFVSVYLASSKV